MSNLQLISGGGNCQRLTYNIYTECQLLHKDKQKLIARNEKLVRALNRNIMITKILGFLVVCLIAGMVGNYYQQNERIVNLQSQIERGLCR